MSKKSLLLLAFLTLAGMGMAGYAIIHFLHASEIGEVLLGETSIIKHLLLGGGYGLITAWIAWKLVELDILAKTRKFFVELIQPFQLTNLEIVFISFCAAVGEEMLFRGGIQPYLGIWITSIIFVGMHGYLSPWNLGLTLYGLLMIVIIAGIGYMAQSIGLLSSVSAHMVVDIILLKKLTEWKE